MALFFSIFRRPLFVVTALLFALSVLAGCKQSTFVKHLKPLSSSAKARLKLLDMEEKSPVYVRIFKQEDELEVWKQKRNGTYGLFKTYKICKWSGELGPKIKEGDRQAPEGFYSVTPGQMNPNSSYYLSFNLGFPNAYDRALNRTGSHLMVHGDCSSAGCYAMTDEHIGEIYALARLAFEGGQRVFDVHAFPFQMTPKNLAAYQSNANMPFWRMLKLGYDHFEVTKKPPKVDVCGKQYVFNATPKPGYSFDAGTSCPPLRTDADIERKVLAKTQADLEEERKIIKNEDSSLIGSIFNTDL